MRKKRQVENAHLLDLRRRMGSLEGEKELVGERTELVGETRIRAQSLNPQK